MMVISRFIFSILLFSSTSQTAHQKEFQITGELNPQLKIFKDNRLRDIAGENCRAVHLSLDLSEQRGRYLVVESKKIFYLFINSTFVLKGSRPLKLNADSLKSRYSNSIFLSLYQKNGIDDLSIKWALLSHQDELYNPQRPTLAFSNFILVTTLILIIFFTALFHTNPQLTLDYLNLTKLFYLRDREENQITLRVTSSVNLLFYLFCSLLASLALITAVHFTKGGLSFLSYSPSSTIREYLGQWIFLGLAILRMLMAKLAFVGTLALLFRW